MLDPTLDYADSIYDKPFNESFKTKIEMIPYWAALVFTWTIKGTSGHCLYQEIGWKSLADKRWFCKAFFFRKIANGRFLSYLPRYLNHCNDGVYQTRSARWRFFLEKPTLLIRLFIYALLRNDVHLVKKFET